MQRRRAGTSRIWSSKLLAGCGFLPIASGNEAEIRTQSSLLQIYDSYCFVSILPCGLTVYSDVSWKIGSRALLPAGHAQWSKRTIKRTGGIALLVWGSTEAGAATSFCPGGAAPAVSTG